jgi:hypothetical protein
MLAHGAAPDCYTFLLALKDATQAEPPGSSLRLQLHKAAVKHGLACHPFIWAPPTALWPT